MRSEIRKEEKEGRDGNRIARKERERKLIDDKKKREGKTGKKKVWEK